jgi:glutamate/aspartate transport system permease protein
MELTAQARNVSEYSFNTFEAFTAATLIYVVISLLVTFVMGHIERSLTLRGATR